jgi:hypothetical protein
MPNLFNNQYANLASKGRFGDTMLAHINPQEAGLLSSMGGAGTINPQTGLREFYIIDPRTGQTEEPYQAPFGTYDMRGPSPKRPEPFDAKFADRTFSGKGTSQITGYTLPTDKAIQGKPLVAKYDPKGNFKFYTMEGDNFLTPDVNQPNIIAQPRLDVYGNIIDNGVFDINQQDDGGFGSFISDLISDFGPMILAGLGANLALSSGLFPTAVGGSTAAVNAGAAAAGGTLAGMGTGATAAGITTAAEAAIAAEAAAAAGGGLLSGGGPLSGVGTGQVGADVLAREMAASAIDPLAAANISGGLTTDAVTRAAAAANAAGGSVSPSMLQSIADKTGISVETLKTFGPSVIQGLIGAGGSILTANQATDAAKTQADAQIRAAQIAADAARFRPVGVTTRFGSSNFKTDAAGNVIEAGYTPSAEITGYQDRLRTLAGQGLTDVEGARTAYQPLTGAAQNLFSLGQGYLAKTPEQAAQDYIAKQTALLAPSRENQLAELRNRQFQTGRGGVAVSQGGNLMATNPEMAAYYNSLAQSDLALAAQADEEARRRITYGAGLFDTGANLQGRYYTGQTAAYSPFTTAMDTSTGLERLAQQPLDLSTAIGQKVSTATADVGRLTGQGIINAAGTMAPADRYSAAGNVLTGAAGSPVFASAVNKAFGNTQQPTQQQYTYDPVTKQFVPVQSSSVFV